MKIIDKFLGEGEYYEEIIEKNTIYLHHTAGSHRPDWVIAGWNEDTQVANGVKTKLPVATAYVMGGASTRDPKDISFDGVIYRCFDEKYWAHHLGTTFPNNRQLNKQSIAIEICNYGPLKLSTDGKYYTYVNTPVPDNMIVKLDKPFRGYDHYHAYTDNQIAALKELLLSLKSKYPKIPFKTTLFTSDAYELQNNAKLGVPGIWTHTNVLTSKFDVSPQPKLITMLKEICTPF